MAKDSKKATAPAETVPADDGDENSRVGRMHELFAEHIKEATGIDITPDQVFAVTSQRVAFRKGEAYQEFKSEREEAKAEAARLKQERADELAAKRAEKEKAKEEKASAPKPARGKAAKKTAAEALAEADSDSDEGDAEATPAPAKPAAKKRGKKAPF